MGLTHLDLFSGVGGFALSARWAGIETVQFCEIEPFCHKVLNKNFPGIPIHDDIRTLDCIALHRANIWHTRWDEVQQMKLNPKYQEAPRLYYELGSIQAVAEKFGVTRQCMWEVLRSRGVKFYPQAREGESNHFYRGGVSAQDAAQNKLEKALKYGKITRPSLCEVCGKSPQPFKDGRSGIQAHHDDYDKPLEVRWLCQKCHHNLHREIYLKEVKTQEAPVQINLITGGFP